MALLCAFKKICKKTVSPSISISSHLTIIKTNPACAPKPKFPQNVHINKRGNFPKLWWSLVIFH
jgi:hypothetical protein